MALLQAGTLRYPISLLTSGAPVTIDAFLTNDVQGNHYGLSSLNLGPPPVAATVATGGAVPIPTSQGGIATQIPIAFFNATATGGGGADVDVTVVNTILTNDAAGRFLAAWSVTVANVNVANNVTGFLYLIIPHTASGI